MVTGDKETDKGKREKRTWVNTAFRIELASGQGGGIRFRQQHMGVLFIFLALYFLSWVVGKWVLITFFSVFFIFH